MKVYKLLGLFILLMQSAYASSRLDELRNNYSLIFIFQSTCPHCQQLAPVVHDFAHTFQIELKAYSLDGQTLDSFAVQALPADLFQSLYVVGGFKTVVPALFLMNRHTLQTYAVLFGEAQPYQLANRINELMQHIEESVYD